MGDGLEKFGWRSGAVCERSGAYLCLAVRVWHLTIPLPLSVVTRSFPGRLLRTGGP